MGGGDEAILHLFSLAPEGLTLGKQPRRDFEAGRGMQLLVVGPSHESIR